MMTAMSNSSRRIFVRRILSYRLCCHLQLCLRFRLTAMTAKIIVCLTAGKRVAGENSEQILIQVVDARGRTGRSIDGQLRRIKVPSTPSPQVRKSTKEYLVNSNLYHLIFSK